MKTTIEIDWSGGKITPELIHAMLIQYFQTLGRPLLTEEINIKEIKEE